MPGWRSAVSPPSETLPGATAFTYGKVGDRLLRVHVFEPADDGKKRPTLLYFFGGGLLAATTALRASRKNRPQALVLINPVLNLTAGAWAQDQTPAEAAAYSASSLPIGALPPTIIFHGTADTVVPIQSSRAFCARASRAGRICRLVEYPGMRHGFSDKRQNAPSLGNSPFDDTLTKSLDFLSAPSKVAP